MNIRKVSVVILTILLANCLSISLAQDFIASDYNKALWMTTRFYGAQRSSDVDALERVNWTVYNHKPDGVSENKRGISFAQDADGSHDLSGGWFDCGDHVKFGQTNFYAGYMLLKGYAEFPEGYADYYSDNYGGYGTAGDWSWESGAGQPNGIPDILDEVKHATDFYIKCAKSSSSFYYEVGHGNYDHAKWQTSVKMQTNPVTEGGEIRPVFGNPSDGAMASFCSATLALMSRMYRPFDAAYADLCLQHAKYAHDYAAAHVGQGVGAASGSFYSSNDNPKNPWAICLAEMHWATNQSTYKNKALSLGVSASNLGDVHPNSGYTFDYSNNGELALYVLAQLGHPDAKAAFNSRISSHWLSSGNYNSEGAYSAGGGWGKLRYVGNAGFLVALHSKLNGTALNAKVYDNVDYIMGGNNASFSFIVGFGSNSPKYPHHRNAYLRDDNPGNSTVIPVATKNKQLGALVGGSLSSGSYNDDRNDYVNSEVCIDYNAGLVGALGAIKSVVDPIDPNSFLTQCTSPGDLGGNQSLCGIGSIELNTDLTTKNNRTFQWFKNDVSQGSPSANALSKTITEAGTWKVVVDSAGECQRSATVVISGTLPNINLGSDIDLCSPSEVVLDAGVSGAGITYNWKKGTESVGTSSSYNVTTEGNYSLTINAAGCPSKSDNITVTSSLPEVTATPICKPGQATLNVTSSGGPYEWYATNSSNTLLFTGNPYSPSITTNTTYYVKDAGSFNSNIGPVATVGTSNAWGEKEHQNSYYLKLDVTGAFSITSLKVPFSNVNTQSDAKIGINIYTSSGELKGAFTSNARSVSSANNGLVEFTFDDFNITPSMGASLRMALDKDITNVNGQIQWSQGGASYPYTTASNVVTITGANTDQSNNEVNYVYFYDWKISSGSDCDRKPVTATIDTNDPNCSETCSPPTSAVITPSATQVICSGDSLELSANLVSGYLYRWYRNGTAIAPAVVNNNKLKITQAGAYSVRIGDGSVIDNSCYLESSSVTITVTTAPIANITTTNLSYCSTENGITLTAADAGADATYNWSGPVTSSSRTITNATEGIYFVSVNKNGCNNKSSSVLVIKKNQPIATIISTTLEYCSTSENGVTLTAASAGSEATYSWTGPVTGTAITLENAIAGLYSVKVSKDGCEATSATKTVIVNCLNGISNKELFNLQFNLFPNPSVEGFQLELPDGFKGVVRVVNINGVLMSEDSIENQASMQFGSELEQGVYVLQVIQDNRVFTNQITKLD